MGDEVKTRTPGPWKRTINGRKYIEVIGADGNPVVGWSGFDDCNRSITTHQADARLISAAPDLLDACIEARSAIDYLMGDSDLPEDDSDEMTAMQMLSAAIAKAEGK